MGKLRKRSSVREELRVGIVGDMSRESRESEQKGRRECVADW